MQAFPGQIDLFGRGFKEIGDKADVIGPYRYHLVLENSACPHFWTEKLADAYLGYCLPIFSGCANVVDYFPPDSLVRLPDIADHSGAVTIVGIFSWDERTQRRRGFMDFFTRLIRMVSPPIKPTVVVAGLGGVAGQHWYITPSLEAAGTIRMLAHLQTT